MSFDVLLISQIVNNYVHIHSLPIGLMYDMYQLHLFVLSAGTERTFQLYGSGRVQAVFKRFGMKHRENVDEIYAIQDGEERYVAVV